MLSDAAIYGIVAAVMILVMFMLFVNVAKMNLAKKRSKTAEIALKPNPPANPENTAVYPLYVDCSVSFTRYGLE